MHRRAVDIVLVPPDEMGDRAIALNRRLSGPTEQKIILDRIQCVPHISLAMGVMDDDQLTEVCEELAKIASKREALRLRATTITEVHIPTGEVISSIQIANSPELYALHYDAMTLSEYFFSHHATIDHFFSTPPVEAVSVQFVDRYPIESAYANFRPHITLGVGTVPEKDIQATFVSDTLALYHLGSYCTCRDLLYSTQLL
jgi:2'-5' RNA ligase